MRNQNKDVYLYSDNNNEVIIAKKNKMTTTKKQYRVTFENPTAFSNQRASTMWYNSLEDCAKWLNNDGAEIVERETTKDTNSLRNAMNAKFNN